MKTIKTKTRKIGLGFLSLITAVIFSTSAYALEPGKIGGKMISFNPYTNSIVLNVKVLGLSGLENKDVAFSISEDANWTICIGGECVDKRGDDGIKLLEEYASFEAYGLSPENSKVTVHKLRKLDNKITSVTIDIP